MSINITAIRQAGGTGHEHIVRLWWINPAEAGSGEKNSTTAEVVSFIEDKNGKAYVNDHRGHRVDVGVVTPRVGAKYLRTYADGVWTDNLLALPRR
jgi:hypothetical protein